MDMDGDAEQAVGIALALHHLGDAERAAGTRLVGDHDARRNDMLVVQDARDGAAEQVHPAARRERNDHLDRLGRIIRRQIFCQ